MSKTPIRSASASFTSSDVALCSNPIQLRKWRFTVDQDILSLQMQLDVWTAPDVVRDQAWIVRARCCLKMQQILLSKIDEQLFTLKHPVELGEVHK